MVGTCNQIIGSNTQYAICCCSVGKAWGTPCKACPVNGTIEFKALCIEGIGRGPDSESTIIDGMCLFDRLYILLPLLNAFFLF